MSPRPKVILLGLGPTAESALRSLLSHVDVAAVVRDADAPDDPVRTLAAEHGIPVHEPDSHLQVVALIARQRPDGVVISSYNRVMGAEALTVCPFVNVHYAPLPRYRGNAPVNWAIINGEGIAAITIHRVDSGLDSGNILYQAHTPITAEDTAASLFARLNQVQERHLGTTVVRALQGWGGSPQTAEDATYGCARNAEDGEIDWACSADAIERLVRALTPPFPGAFTFHLRAPLIIHRATALPGGRAFAGSIPGRVVDLSPGEGWIDVLTGRGVLRVVEVARPGAGPRRAAELVRSRRARLGLRSADLAHRIAELELRLARLEARNGPWMADGGGAGTG